jgi:hypothetical protein
MAGGLASQQRAFVVIETKLESMAVLQLAAVVHALQNRAALKRRDPTTSRPALA